jgi:hypothetical protein
LVTSLGKPGGNVTGLTFDVDATQLAAKRLEILKELIPSVSRVAVLWNPDYRPGLLRVKGTEEAGASRPSGSCLSSSRREPTPSARSRRSGMHGLRRSLYCRIRS